MLQIQTARFRVYHILGRNIPAEPDRYVVVTSWRVGGMPTCYEYKQQGLELIIFLEETSQLNLIDML